MPEREQPRHPQAWFLTWTTYGTWLHGDARGWRDRKDDYYPGKHKTDPLLEARRRKQLKHAPITLTDAMRTAVEFAIREVCDYRGWHLSAINVRTNHVHCVVIAAKAAEDVLRDFKAYATRRLRRDGLIAAGMEIWTEGGDKDLLTSEGAVAAVVEYVLLGQ